MSILKKKKKLTAKEEAAAALASEPSINGRVFVTTAGTYHIQPDAEFPNVFSTRFTRGPPVSCSCSSWMVFAKCKHGTLLARWPDAATIATTLCEVCKKPLHVRAEDASKRIDRYEHVLSRTPRCGHIVHTACLARHEAAQRMKDKLHATCPTCDQRIDVSKTVDAFYPKIAQVAHSSDQ